MLPSFNEAHEPLLRRLSAAKRMPGADQALLAQLSWRLEDRPARLQFVQEGDRTSESCIIVSGIVVRSRYTSGGQRQILSAHIPGDMPDLQSLHLGRMDHVLETVSPCRIAFVDHGDLRRVCDQSPSLTAAFWRETLVDAALYRAAIFRNAQLEADARLAHFICEMHLRHEAVGLTTPEGFRFSMSQELIGEAVGLTTVSVNRAAQTLRARNLIRMERGSIQVLDWDALARFCEFDPLYLHLHQERDRRYG
ncbi:Crp/Fnr family transcriptional regulator [Aureimonas sp. AU22]|uniref:Crp/Fnr family transcriptional regulator n=1 Tax=Aureimonas sp. AU22 TaxID=1638162 RepID=UPI0007830E0C|nr:Crp/Fnr family transcriptional regulator [Aureimonas sp. AU22]